MPSSSVSFRHFILGMLNQQPMSGYDIKTELDNLSWLVGNASFGSLYPALHALHEDGLVTVEVISQSKPARKVYSITEAGKRVLQKWINRSTGSGTSLKAFVMRLALADNFSTAGLVAQLRNRRAQIAADHGDLEQTAKTLDSKSKLKEKLALEYGMALADAELSWLNKTLDRLVQQPLATESVRGN